MITWKIEKFTTISNETHEDIVKNIAFNIKYEKNDKLAETRGNKDVPYNPETFTLYNDITEQQAVNWVKETLGTAKVEALENLVKGCYENMGEDEISAFIYTNESLTSTEKTDDALPF